MARKHKHEEHTNHEAWAIPYGDLVTLLLAFFVVMYAVSSVNEGKYRVLSDSLSAALGGPPRTMNPIQLGQQQPKGSKRDSEQDFSAIKIPQMDDPLPALVSDAPGQRAGLRHPLRGREGVAAQQEADFAEMTEAIREAMRGLIEAALVTVRRSEEGLEIEINTDLLFASGVAGLPPEAQSILRQLAEILRPFPQRLRIEGHTDDRPIATAAFPSNWELSAARAASVVRLFADQGIEAQRMTVIGYGEFRPIADNHTPEGRNRNRRVVVVVMADPDAGLPGGLALPRPAAEMVRHEEPLP